ncbi:energy transducer TonB [Xylophilus sp. GW821-FHT01B05]
MKISVNPSASWAALGALALAALLGGCAATPPAGPAAAQASAQRHFDPVTGIESVAPFYPAESRRRGEQGRVLMRVQVGPGGQAAQVELLQSSGFPLLDAAAIDCVRQWRFLPTAAAPAPAGSWREVPLTFTLQR